MVSSKRDTLIRKVDVRAIYIAQPFLAVAFCFASDYGPGPTYPFIRSTTNAHILGEKRLEIEISVGNLAVLIVVRGGKKLSDGKHDHDKNVPQVREHFSINSGLRATSQKSK